MKIAIATIFVLAVGTSASLAASVVNQDKEQRTLVVTEGDRKSEIIVDAGATLEFCATGCFVTMPDGDREVLKGSETIEISGGKGQIK